jgi:hypothetical protein
MLCSINTGINFTSLESMWLVNCQTRTWAGYLVTDPAYTIGCFEVLMLVARGRHLATSFHVYSFPSFPWFPMLLGKTEIVFRYIQTSVESTKICAITVRFDTFVFFTGCNGLSCWAFPTQPKGIEGVFHSRVKIRMYSAYHFNITLNS